MMLVRLLKSWRWAIGARKAGAGPAHPAADNALPQAEACFAAGKYAEAQPHFEMLLKRRPDDALLLFRLGVIYGNTGSLNDAELMLNRAARLLPQSVDVHNALANVAWLQAMWARAGQHFEKALELEPRNAALWANFGLCLHDAGRLDAASQALQRALEFDPAHPDALVNAALVRMDSGDTTGAGELLQRALQAAPDFAEAHVLYAQLLLRQGEYTQGWREYEWRFHAHDVRYRLDTKLPPWHGIADPARTLMVYAEQGLGDQIMFASCLPDVMPRIAKCEVECDPRLVRLFTRSFPAARFHPRQPDLERDWAAAAQADKTNHIYAGSLPKLFRNDLNQFPVHRGYLLADPARTALWSAKLAELGAGLKVGIAWRGGVPRTRQTLRSIPLSKWLPALRMNGIQFVSLQHGQCDDELREISSAKEIHLTHWQHAIDDLDEMAALIASLDVVISVCGTVVHLAGALGKTVWVMVPACPEWRYMGSGDAMPWYPAARLFRQTGPGDWDRPFADVIQLLSAAARGHNGNGNI